VDIPVKVNMHIEADNPAITGGMRENISPMCLPASLSRDSHLAVDPREQRGKAAEAQASRWRERERRTVGRERRRG
jgi:hypothetical protein